jgi:hypothetical protein
MKHINKLSGQYTEFLYVDASGTCGNQCAPKIHYRFLPSHSPATEMCTEMSEELQQTKAKLIRFTIGPTHNRQNIRSETKVVRRTFGVNGCKADKCESTDHTSNQ